MTENNNKINQLNEKLDLLLKRQLEFSIEVHELKDEINKLKEIQINESIEEKVEQQKECFDFDLENDVEIPLKEKQILEPFVLKPQYSSAPYENSPKIKSDLEKFIGENLINKIGIIITVIGVAIGAKYSIEHQLISPAMRIILGYLMGLGLLGIGIKLKKNYENYSAVLVSGAMAIMFFITYAAYSFYALFPQGVAFLLMLIFTVFTVLSAIKYDKQVIAHIGLVGAYAVPFLLSDGSGNILILFTYMSIINIGILIIAFKKYWKPLYYSSFLLSWLIFYLWYSTEFQAKEHFRLSLTFITVFFATFYAIFLAYKLLRKEKFELEDIILLLTNSFLFYGTGYSILNTHTIGKELLGLFTLGNALIHFLVCIIIYKQKLADRNLFYLVAGLGLIFITIAIPVQLDGNWVTLLWVAEAALLFWIGRTKQVIFYERLSYPMMLLAFISIVIDWVFVYQHYYTEAPHVNFIPFININFLSSFLFIVAFLSINYLNLYLKNKDIIFHNNVLNNIVKFAIPTILIIVFYTSFRIEIEGYWYHLYNDSLISLKNVNAGISEQIHNENLLKFKSIWLINYSLLFFTLLSFINNKKIKNSTLGMVNLLISAYVLLFFLGDGLYTLGELRDSYLNQTIATHFHSSFINISLRYISFLFVSLMIFSIYKSIKQEFMRDSGLKYTIAFDGLLYITIIWISSSELINIMDILHSTQSYKLGLSILWGVYALLMIILGIWKKKKHLRIGAIALFAITLIKLFAYDISDMNTISKTVVFVLLGILLLIISFLYNKYKHLIKDEGE
ncbi:MAG: DUF2339 domain-containing protein [Bacteroidales bacterium]